LVQSGIPIYTLTLAVDGAGSLQPPPGTYPYIEGAKVTLFAMAQTGWVFDHWEGGVSDTANPWAAIVMNADTALTAVFVPEPAEGEGEGEGEPGPFSCFKGSLEPPSGGKAGDLMLMALALVAMTGAGRKRTRTSRRTAC
jgi:hypothetical protein